MKMPRALICSGFLVAASSAQSRSSEDDLVIFHVQIGRNGSVIAEAELRVGGNDSSSFERSWPVEGMETCVSRFDDTRHVGASNRIRVHFEPIRDRANGKARPQFVRVLGSWSEGLSANDGGQTSECSNFPLHSGSAVVMRVIPMDLAQPVRLRGDAGLFVQVTRR